MKGIPTQLTFQETTEEYRQFVDKFKPKKTTDDCFTPPNIYETVLSWVCNTYDVDRDRVCRPFYPGGDYERYEYDDDAVVVDNPPFSIISEIVAFYNEHCIDYFLFAPHLTNLGIGKGVGCCHVIANAAITYENGAEVNTSFVTNLDSRLIYADPSLYYAIKEANKENTKSDRTIPKYEFPDNIVTAAKVGWIVNKGVPYELKRTDAVHIRALDSMRNAGKAIFGSGFLISDRAAAEKAAAVRWPLSPRELRIIEELNKHGK